MPQQAPMTVEQREMMAREAGFPSYEAMRLFHDQRSRRRQSQTVQGRPRQLVSNVTPTSVSPEAERMSSWNPLAVFQRIGDTLRGSR